MTSTGAVAVVVTRPVTMLEAMWVPKWSPALVSLMIACLISSYVAHCEAVSTAARACSIAQHTLCTFDNCFSVPTLQLCQCSPVAFCCATDSCWKLELVSRSFHAAAMTEPALLQQTLQGDCHVLSAHDIRQRVCLTTTIRGIIAGMMHCGRYFQLKPQSAGQHSSLPWMGQTPSRDL